MDLTEYIHNKVWILHFIDDATRYSAARLIRTKDPDEIIQHVYFIINLYGLHTSVVQKNFSKGEFSNETYREMNEKLMW